MFPIYSVYFIYPSHSPFLSLIFSSNRRFTQLSFYKSKVLFRCWFFPSSIYIINKIHHDLWWCFIFFLSNFLKLFLSYIELFLFVGLDVLNNCLICFLAAIRLNILQGGIDNTLFKLFSKLALNQWIIIRVAGLGNRTCLNSSEFMRMWKLKWMAFLPLQELLDWLKNFILWAHTIIFVYNLCAHIFMSKGFMQFLPLTLYFHSEFV